MASGENKEVIEKPDWTIEELYKKAWQIVKNNKMLWVFGAGIGAATSFSGSSSNNSDIKDLQKLFEGEPTKSQELTRVLGAATSATEGIISHLFSAIPLYLWILLGLEFLFLILFGVFVSLIYQAWATGALLENVDRCIKGGKATIREASEKAFTVLKPLLWLEFIPGLFLTFGSILGSMVLVVGIMFAPSFSRIIFGLLFFGFALFLMYAWTMLMASLIWATRQVVTEGKSAKEAFRCGYNMVKKKFWSMLLLGMVNNLLVAIVFGIPIAIIIGLIIGAAYTGLLLNIFDIFTIILIIGGILLFALIIAGTVVSGILGAFKATVWSLAYNNIKGKYEKI